MNIEMIWSDYQIALKRFLHSKVSNEADVDDLLQDILLKTYNNLNTIKDHRSIKSWLFQIANHTIIDFYRKKGRIKEIEPEDIWILDDDNQVKKGLSRCIMPFIKALPEEQAELIIAIDINNQSQKEYAEAIGVSYSTLKSRVQKSRQELKSVFDQCCYFKVDQHGNVYDFENKSGRCEPTP